VERSGTTLEPISVTGPPLTEGTHARILGPRLALGLKVADDDVMTRIALIICTVCAVGVAMFATASAVTTRTDSGLRGQVLYGPTCPVQRPGQTCERPYQATIVVTYAGARGVIARVGTSADGRFTVRLRAGRYLVKVTGRTAYPRSWSRTVSVTAHRFTALTIRFDSGIR